MSDYFMELDHPEKSMYDLAKAYVDAVEHGEEHPHANSDDEFWLRLDELVKGVRLRLQLGREAAADKRCTPLMDLTEFRDLGFLQEVNRCFFHPLGLALAVEVEEHGPQAGKVIDLYGIYDSRQDPEGWLYGDWPEDADLKVGNVAQGRRAHARERAKLMADEERSKGMVLSGIQPVGWLPPKADDDG